MELYEKRVISTLRVFAMILILMCHIVQEHSNAYVNMTAQFFNVGVSIFIVISGYLYGSKDINERYFTWVKKRAKRILIPMYVFMGYLLILNLLKGNNLNITNWLAYVFNLQGFEIYVHGAEHLWYLTIIMICYLITPMLNRIKAKINIKSLFICIPILVFIQFIISYFVSTQIGIYLIYVYLYIMAYVIGNKKIYIDKLYILILVGILSVIIRLLGRALFDDTIFYNVIITGYTQAILAITIFFVFIYFGNFIKENKLIRYLDSLSFSIYLSHYMYMVGPLRLMGLTNSFILNTVITLIASIITAIILEKICKFIFSII